VTAERGAPLAFEIPVVHSTINVATGRGKPTLPELAEVLADDKPLDRTTTNSWEDLEFVQAVHATGRRKLVICALWTEICMAFTALDALREGYEVYPVVDAIGGTSPEAHRAGLDRVLQAGGQPVSWVSLAVELQRDWAREDTVAAVIEIVLTDRLLKEQEAPSPAARIWPVRDQYFFGRTVRGRPRRVMFSAERAR